MSFGLGTRLPELSFSDRCSRGTKLWERETIAKCLNVAFVENRFILIFLLYVLNRIIVIIYITLIEFSFVGNGEGDVLYAEEILQPHLKAFPKV